MDATIGSVTTRLGTGHLPASALRGPDGRGAGRSGDPSGRLVSRLAPTPRLRLLLALAPRLGIGLPLRPGLGFLLGRFLGFGLRRLRRWLGSGRRRRWRRWRGGDRWWCQSWGRRPGLTEHSFHRLSSMGGLLTHAGPTLPSRTQEHKREISRSAGYRAAEQPDPRRERGQARAKV